MQQRKVSNTYKFIALIGLLALLTAWGCSPTRRLHGNQKLLNKVKIEVDDKTVNTGDAEDYLQQKPNRKLLGFWRFYLQVYNLVDSTKAANDHKRRFDNKTNRQIKRNARRDKHCNKLIERYRKKGKTYKCKVYEDDGERIEAKPFREWIQGIGEAPSVYDTLLTHKSIVQLKQYMFNTGYFFATVNDTITEAGDIKVNLFYRIKAGHQYIVDSIKYVASDTVLQKLLDDDTGEKLVFANKPFSTEALADEQTRLSTLIKSKGYFFFNNEFVKVNADTSKGNFKTTISFVIKNPQVVTGKSGEDSLAEGRHIQYKLGKMTVNLGYDPSSPDHAAYDSTIYNGSVYYYPPALKPMFRPKTIDYHIFLRKDSIYSDSKLDITLSRLSDLRNFKFINVQFNPVPMVDSTDGKGILNYDILLTPSMRQAYTIESQGTNTGGNLGIGATLGFINKNLFRGEESLEFRVRGALEFQRLVTNTGNTSNNNLFNTQEYGASLTLNIPRGIWPIHYFVKDPLKNPRSAITTSYNYQNRPQYDRRAYTLTFGWNWKQNKRLAITYNPVELNFLSAKLSDAYYALLPNVLRKSFENTFVDAGRVSLVWSNQIPDKRVNYVFWRLGAESAGLLLNSVKVNKISLNGDDIKTAQYLRADFEIYPNFYFNDKNAFAFRGYLGIGLPYGNTNRALPFSKSFFSGGSNGMRAWLQRSLGPGVFDKSTGNIDQVGDVKMEFNAEYRVKLFSFIEPALFVDVGNIWLLINDPQRPGGKFGSQFYKQFGVDYGIGLRLDLSFFLLRLDFARRLVDPGREYNGEKFLSPFKYEKYQTNPGSPDQPIYKRSNPVVFQLGIGYPF
jgi:outer membrane protein assembly factor BamA